MLKKENRIRHEKDFDRAFKSGRSFYGQILNIKKVANSLNKNRFGIVISNKISKKAVERNLLRRFIREEIKKYNSTDSIGFDYVIIVNRAFKEIIFTNVSDILKKYFQK